MSTMKVAAPDQLDNAEVARLRADVIALGALVAEIGGRLAPGNRVETAVPVDEWIARATPDEMLDRWQAVRGERAEAHLLTRIHRRRAARRV
jgi:hypothetical protein